LTRWRRTHGGRHQSWRHGSIPLRTGNTAANIAHGNTAVTATLPTLASDPVLPRRHLAFSMGEVGTSSDCERQGCAGSLSGHRSLCLQKVGAGVAGWLIGGRMTWNVPLWSLVLAASLASAACGGPSSTASEEPDESAATIPTQVFAPLPTVENTATPASTSTPKPAPAETVAPSVTTEPSPAPASEFTLVDANIARVEHPALDRFQAVALSPDGTLLAYEAPPEVGEDHICFEAVAQTDDAECYEVPFIGFDSLTWSPDGEFVVSGSDMGILDQRAVPVWLVALNGQSSRPAASPTIDEFVGESNSSTNGQDVAFLQFAHDGRGQLVNQLVVTDGISDRVIDAPRGALLSLAPIVWVNDHLLLVNSFTDVFDEEGVWAVDLRDETWSHLSGVERSTTDSLQYEPLHGRTDDGTWIVGQDPFKAQTWRSDDTLAPVALLDTASEDPQWLGLRRAGLISRDAAISPDGERLVVVWEPAKWRPGTTPDKPRFRLSFAPLSDVTAGEPIWQDVELAGFDDFNVREWSTSRRRSISWTTPGELILIGDSSMAFVEVPPSG